MELLPRWALEVTDWHPTPLARWNVKPTSISHSLAMKSQMCGTELGPTTCRLHVWGQVITPFWPYFLSYTRRSLDQMISETFPDLASGKSVILCISASQGSPKHAGNASGKRRSMQHHLFHLHLSLVNLQKVKAVIIVTHVKNDGHNSISWTIIMNTIMFQSILTEKRKMEPVEQTKKFITT